jgi:phosphohistidine phosphatase
VVSVMLIGHNPGIQDLALELARSGAEIPSMTRKFPTGALATLELDRGWSGLTPESCELVSFVKPKQLAKSS